jgi:hypothetical protein
MKLRLLDHISLNIRSPMKKRGTLQSLGKNNDKASYLIDMNTAQSGDMLTGRRRINI